MNGQGQRSLNVPKQSFTIQLLNATKCTKMSLKNLKKSFTYFAKLSVDGFGRNHTTKVSESSIDTLCPSSFSFIILAFEAFLGHVGHFFNWAATKHYTTTNEKRF